MPTLPSEQPRSRPAPADTPSASTPHEARAIAESFGADAARYDRTRPPYPAELIERIRDTAPGGEILDVGTGTGIVARQFRGLGCTVLGVEPDARMAEFARGTGIETEVATFEKWESGGRRFDAVVSGTAWHWVDPVAGAARAGRVLRPGGLLAPFNHVFQMPPEVAERVHAVYRRVVPDSPFADQPARPALDVYQAFFDTAADGIRQSGAFGEPERWQHEWRRTYTRDEWLDQLPTTGMFTRLEPDRLAEILAGVGAAIDDLGGSFTMPYTTVAVAAVRKRGDL
ncbi:class I SAM-dependent methyltransferase [Nocardia miyunensis]|uniref:class I SAM-dependent methyltransferase n=1 Tax=Nocardia miyunensis TaxID=282684 RepID=UPI000833F0EE|nr:class I SAM-dependent methyltransferase [Nocardia miyunensis]